MIRALVIVVALTGCTTNVLGPADEASVRANLSLDTRIYNGLDGGLLRAFARAAACNDEALLRRDGVITDASTPIPCEVAR